MATGMKRRDAKIAELAATREPWEPPAILSDDAALVWRETVDSVSAEHFEEGDKATLIQWCETHARLRKLTAAQNRLPVVTKDKTKAAQAFAMAREIGALRHATISLARLLRLAPSTRPHARNIKTGMPTRNPQKAAALANGAPSDNDLLP